MSPGAGGQGHAAGETTLRCNEKGGRPMETTAHIMVPRGRGAADQAASFTFSTATATRLEIGWAASPASLTIASALREASAT
jgi:hypothetical protein